ncbi:tetratricopeptide repeat protein [Pontibacter sp. 172403-2]|uniref:tetratricopeptide repeat protein n=1 Tax=Pontibacter rufus TaxID=2791028 RepID=UPI0018AF9BCE|nr:tetratricopeptide repeat protein [Pontibacter sp. 172403-2]MBF9255016.1 tetratricopeptide repeat protein [Pontibacter sp. 172403-2]
MKTKLYYLVFLWACLGCASIGDSTPDEEWNRKTVQYSAFTDKEQYGKALTIALEQVRTAENEFPKSIYMADAYNRLGLAYRNIKDFQKAEQYLKKSLVIANAQNTITTSIHQNLALVYKETGKLDLAIASIQDALDSYATEPVVDSTSMYHAKVILVELLTIKQDYEQAFNLLKETVEYSLATGDSSLLMGATSAYVELSMHLGQYEDALKGAERLRLYYERSGENERYANAINHKGAVYFVKQDYERAIEYFEKAAENKLSHFKDSSYIAIQLKNIALAYERNGNKAAAAEYYKLYESAKK